MNVGMQAPGGACARCPNYCLQPELVGGYDDEEHPEDSLGEVVELERQEEVGKEDRQGDGGNDEVHGRPIGREDKAAKRHDEVNNHYIEVFAAAYATV